VIHPPLFGTRIHHEGHEEHEGKRNPLSRGAGEGIDFVLFVVKNPFFGFFSFFCYLSSTSFRVSLNPSARIL